MGGGAVHRSRPWAAPPLGYRDQIVPGIPYQVQRFAEIAEATYRFDLGHGVLLAPDFQ